MAALLTLGKTNHIRGHLRVTYEDFSGSPNETRLEEIMEHMEVFLAFLEEVEDAPKTSVKFNNSDKFLQYAPSVSRQRWDSAFRQYVNGSIGSYGGVIVDDVAYFSAVFELHQNYGEDIMNDIVETVSVQNLVAFTSADLLMSFSWGQRDTMTKSHIQNCFEYVYIIFGFAVNNQFMSQGLAHAQRHVRELGESLQSTFLSSLEDRPRNVRTRKENGSALKGKGVFDTVFQLLIRSEPLEYPLAYRHYPNLTDDPLENWLRLQGYYMGISGSSELYFIVYHPEEYVKFKDFRLMLHYLMFPFYTNNAHVGVLAGGLGLRLAATVFYRIIDEAGAAEAEKIYRRNQDCLGLDEKEVDLDLQGAIAAVPVTQKLYSKMLTQAHYSKLLGSIQSFTDVQVPFVAGCYLLCGEERGPDLCNIPLMHSVDFSRAFRCSRHAKMNPKEKCSMVPH